MLEKMHITYEKFSTLSNTASLQQTVFDRYVRTNKTTLNGVFIVYVVRSIKCHHISLHVMIQTYPNAFIVTAHLCILTKVFLLL